MLTFAQMDFAAAAAVNVVAILMMLQALLHTFAIVGNQHYLLYRRNIVHTFTGCRFLFKLILLPNKGQTYR